MTVSVLIATIGLMLYAAMFGDRIGFVTMFFASFILITVLSARPLYRNVRPAKVEKLGHHTYLITMLNGEQIYSSGPIYLIKKNIGTQFLGGMIVWKQ